MNVALIAVIFLAVAGLVGAVLSPTEAEVRAGQEAPAADTGHDDHGHGGHGHSDHGHGH
jgi:hypothetical protein